MSIFGPSKLTYGDFSRTGAQDCANAVSIDEFDYEGGGTAQQIVYRTWAQWEDDGMEEQWLSQQDDFEGLDPHKAYEAWASGWKGRAIGYVERELDDRRRRREDDEEYEREHGNPPAKWWHRPSPGPRACYRSKADALKVFLDTNSDIVENYGGADYEVSPSEFDSINHKYELKGKRAARSIADAVWHAMPVGKPYCLDRIDIDALNDTSPAREAGFAFRLPDLNYELQAQAEEAAHYAAQAEDVPDWVTEHEREPHRVFPPVPSMEGLVFMRSSTAEQFQRMKERSQRMKRNHNDQFAGKLRERKALRSAIEQWLVSVPPEVRTEDDAVEAMVETSIACDDFTFTPSAEMVRSVYRDMHAGAGRKPNPSPGWVTKVVADHYDDLEGEVPAKWLPKVTSPSAQGARKITARLEEYGCGAYGCVLPTYDPKVVLKLTTDETEAQFAHSYAKKLSAPVVVKYRKTMELPERHQGHSTFLLWRDSADEVGRVIDAVVNRGGSAQKAFSAIKKQHSAAQKAYDALYEGKPATKLIEKWKVAAKGMGEAIPELHDLAEGMIKVVEKDKIFFGDIHDGNIGLVDDKWVIIDPGHVAVLTS